MIKKKNKIKVILTEDGSIKKIELPVKIHTGSVNMTDIEVFVPITVNRTSTSFVKIYGNTINEKGEKVWSSETYNINFKTIDVIDKFEYAVYEDKFPDEFSNICGDLNLTLAYADLDNEGSIIDVLPSQTIHLHVSGAGFNENGINISNYDATVARVNLLSELSIFKLDISKELPLGIVFNKDGYKSPFYNFYTIEYTLPINASDTAIKQCRVIANSIVKDSESPGVIGYQTEYAYFDGGICKRTNKYNISQGSVNNYVLLENGVWEIVNQGYITPIKLQVEQNSEDIEVLYRLVNTGSTPLGDYPSQDTVPTDSELNSFVQENFGREPQNGDELTFVLLVEDGTDIVYILKYSEVTQSWGKTALPSVEPAKNGSLGIIQGTSEEAISETRKVLVDINNGEINDILHNNENGEKESLSSQTNRNSQNIAINTKDISDNQENLNIEITRAKEEEQTIANNLSAEIERAKQAEQTNTTAIENEVTRATSKEEEKLDKVNINDNYLKDIVFSVNGDNGVANVELNNPVTGETKTIEITVTSPASSTNTGLMTANMVQALNNAIEDIESLKYIGKQVASFQTHAEAELFDFSTLSNVKINDYFIIQADESRTEPTENGKTTRYVCVNDDAPISLESFQFQGVVTTVNIQVATESKLGGVLSTNTEGYIYVENSGAMKLVGYDKIITNINNLISNITSEIERAKQAEESLNQAVTAETTRAQNVENNLQNVKADKTEIPTKLSELENDDDYAKSSQIPTKLSELENDENYAKVSQIPTDNSQLTNGANYIVVNNIIDSLTSQEVNKPLSANQGYVLKGLIDAEVQGRTNSDNNLQEQITSNVNALSKKANLSGENNFSGDQYFNGDNAEVGVYSVKPIAKSLSKFGLGFYNRSMSTREYGGIFYNYNDKKVFVDFDTLEYDIPYIAESGENYRRWSDGVLECWGTYSRDSSSGDFTDTVTLPSDFINTTYVVNLTAYKNSSDTSYRTLDTSILTKSTTSFVLGGYGNSQPWKIDWTAIGRWK